VGADPQIISKSKGKNLHLSTIVCLETLSQFHHRHRVTYEQMPMLVH